jgi:uncharacterized membrane protein YciS (DUF1049 family)
LRAELIAKNANVTQIVAQATLVMIGIISAVLLAYEAFGLSPSLSIFFGTTSVILCLAVVGISYVWLDRDTVKLSRRLRQIEASVNNLAQEEILVWETLMGARGSIPRAH